MKKYMVLTSLEGEEPRAHFYDDPKKAVHDCDIVQNCLGGFCEVYERQEPTEENDYASGYVLYYEG